MNRLRAWGVPGFRSGTRWKQGAAAVGYAALALLALIGVAGQSAIVIILALELFVVVLLAADAWRLRTRAPLLGARNPAVAAAGWAALLIGGFALLAVAVPPAPRPLAEPPVVPRSTAPPAIPATPPAATPGPPTAAPPPTATSAPAPAAVLESPVLGGTNAAWIKAKGAPSKGIVGDLFAPGTEAAFIPDASGQQRAWHVELSISGPSIPVADARAAAKLLHPPDAMPVRTYIAPRGGQTVEVFRSALLAQAFGDAKHEGAAMFGEEPPGTYIQIAERGSPTTSRVVLGLGNNP